MQKQIVSFILCLLLLSACSLGSGPSQPTSDLVGTQVSLILTSTAAVLSGQISPSETSTAPLILATATPTTAPSATASISPTPTPTPTGDPVTSLGSPDWTSNMDSVSSWYTEDNDYSNIRGENGALLLTSKQAIGWHSWSMHYHQLTNFYLEAAIKTGSCTGNDLYGIIFRAPDISSGYFYTLTCDGRAALRSFDGSEFTLVADYVQSTAIQAGSNQLNKLGVLANGNSLTLYANSQKVMEISTTTFSSGTFGVFISSINTPGFQIALDNISYWILP